MIHTCGLTLGKFAPLHRGHQLLIETALSEVDALIVMIYDCPETTNIPLELRTSWISALYPQVELIEAWDGPREVGDTAEIKKRHEEYVLRRLGPRRISHFYSSEFYGEHMSRALGAINRTVDRQRITISISATAIRADPFGCREYLHPLVYRDLITNVVFLGAPSTGKTTIATRLAQEYGSVWMPEYGREYWEAHQVERRLSLDQLVALAEGHLEREEALLRQANEYLFTDTNALTTAMFSRYYHGTVAPRLVELSQHACARYDLVFVCDTDIPYDDTWDRSGDTQRHIFQKQIVNDLILRKIPFFLLRGDLDMRVNYVKSILAHYRKYANLMALFATKW